MDLLSKSRYLAGRQCDKRLWLDVHRPELASEPEGNRASILEMGIEVGRAAHALFPGGVLVDATPGHHAEAVVQTQLLIRDESVPAIFEAAFEHDGVRIRVDVLERLDRGRFGLREVKASTRSKEVHLFDLAVQLWVLRGAGLEVESTELVQVDNGYIHSAAEIDWKRFFKRSDLTENVEEAFAGVSDDVLSMQRLLKWPDAPAIEPGPHCHKPFSCEFWDHCTSSKSPAWFLKRKAVRAEIKARWLEAAKSGRAWISRGLAKKLAPAQPPVWYLDFEALGPAIPIYPGTRPFEALAFQWSLHRVEADGRIRHLEFLAGGKDDPRVETSESLLAALSGDHAPIIVYSNFESRMLKEMAVQNPARASELDALKKRLFDLLPVIRACIYHPEFGGSFSIKNVAPALAPEVRYDDLGDVAMGTDAATAFARVATGAIEEAEKARLRKALLSYCERDTFALMKVHQALRRLAEERSV